MYQDTVYARKPGTQLVSLLRGNPVYAASLSGASPVRPEQKGPCLILLSPSTEHQARTHQVLRKCKRHELTRTWRSWATSADTMGTAGWERRDYGL